MLKYFSEFVTALSILTVTIGTNLYYYATIEGTMSHVYSFSLIAIFIYLTVKWYEKPMLKTICLIGLLVSVR